MISEKKIILYIRYIPVLIIAFLSILITIMVFTNKYKEHNQKMEDLKTNYIKNSNLTIKNEVTKIYNYIQYKKESSESALKKELKEKTIEIERLISFTYEKYKNSLNKEEIKDKIRDILQNYRFNENRGYFYMPNLKGENVIHPLFPELENKSGLHLKDLRGNYFVKDVLTSLKTKDELFYEFYWKRPETKDKELKKITFNKKLNIYDWYIGTGEYLDVFENRIKNDIIEYVNNIKYGANESFFIIDYEKNVLAHKNKIFLGLNQVQIDNKYMHNILDRILQAHENKEPYFKHISSLTNDEDGVIDSVCYIKSFDEWNWIIGTTYDTKKLKEQINELTLKLEHSNKQELQEVVLVSLVLMLFSLFIFYFFSRELEKRFIKYEKNVAKKNIENRKKDSLLAQQSKMAAMGEMIENIAHQWKQPLSIITTISTANIFKLENKMLELSTIEADMKQIEYSSKFLSSTIDDFRNFFKLKKEKKIFHIKKTFEKTLSLIGNSGINIVSDIEDCELSSYENELIQVLINIINNAKDELVKSNNSEKLILINVEQKNSAVEIRIKDNAGGIKIENIDKIFNAYFTTKKDSGTGIGLFMSKEIVEKHLRGDIVVSNDAYIYNGSHYIGANFLITLKQKL